MCHQNSLANFNELPEVLKQTLETGINGAQRQIGPLYACFQQTILCVLKTWRKNEGEKQLLGKDISLRRH